MNKKRNKGKGASGLQWYKKVYSFLAKNECYLTTPNFDEINIIDYDNNKTSHKRL